MPSYPQIPQLFVGNKFINDLVPGADVLSILNTDGTREVIIDANGAIDGLGGPLTITSASANALAVGRLGATTPAFNVDASTAVSITGINVKSAGAGGGVAVKAIGETNVALTINANGSGTIGIGSVSTGAVTITPATTVTGLLTTTAGLRVGTGATTAGVFGLGTPEEVTLADGVATVTRPYVNLLPEATTADTLDSFVYAAALEGDFLVCTSRATNTITLDNSVTLLLGAATRAVAPGGSIVLQLVGTTWVERAFLTAAS